MPLPADSDPWNSYVREIGLTLQRARTSTGFSQEQVAAAAGIAAYTYRKLEKGESNPGTPANPRLRTLVALAEVLGVRLTDLLPPEAPAVQAGH